MTVPAAELARRARAPYRAAPSVEECRFLAFSLITGAIQSHGGTAQAALAEAVRIGNHSDCIEVLDCGDNGLKIWLRNWSVLMPILLPEARRHHRTVYRGGLYDDASTGKASLSAIPLEGLS